MNEFQTAPSRFSAWTVITLVVCALAISAVVWANQTVAKRSAAPATIDLSVENTESLA